LRRLALGRWRHLAILLPLGLALGVLAGLIWNDLLFAMGAGAGFAVLYGLILALRNPK
jgi:hypothetical protein